MRVFLAASRAIRVKKTPKRAQWTGWPISSPPYQRKTQLGDRLQLALAGFLAGEATPIRYNPTDGDELAEQERRRKRLEDLGETKTQGGIGG